ncbi:MAG: D-alanyl-D-alanine carboxypeptidase family protein [Bacilli bacterium]
MTKLNLFLLTLLFLIISPSCIDKTKINDNPYNKYPFDIMSTYPNYQPNKMEEYYQAYLLTNSMFQAMNKVNHQDYYDYNTKRPFLLGNDLILVNPKYYMESSYIPTNLVEVKNVPYIKRNYETMKLDQTTLIAYEKMYFDASQNNIELIIFSGYRSFEKQLTIYMNNPNSRYIAYPGHSEHQTGLAIDISVESAGLTEHFENTKAFNYLKDNAYKFGFILRYPQNLESITGYLYEPWHYRYVGIDIATFIYQHNITLEEYLYNYTILC